MTPREQVVAKNKECFQKAQQIFGVDLSRVQVLFDLKGRCAGQARRRGVNYSVRYNLDMMMRDLDDMVNDTVPHEIAHIVCFMKPTLGRDHDYGWQHVCHQLGGTGKRTHDLEVVYGKGLTYEYTTSNGSKVRLSELKHKRIQKGATLLFRQGKGTVTRACAYCIVGQQGRTFTAAVGHKPASAVTNLFTHPVVAKVIEAPRPITASNPTSAAVMGYNKPPVPSYVAPPRAESKAETSRRIMMSGHARGEGYEQIITAMMAACGYNRQLARATYKANAARAGVPCDY